MTISLLPLAGLVIPGLATSADQPPDQAAIARAESLFVQGEHAWERGKNDEARAAFEEAIRLYPDFTAAHRELQVLRISVFHESAESLNWSVPHRDRGFHRFGLRLSPRSGRSG